MSQPIRGHGGHLVFPIGPKNTNLVGDVEMLLLVKFHWIPFCGYRGEVENVSANQRKWLPSCFSNRPEKHKLGRGCWVLASCQVSLNSVQRFQRRSRKCEKLTTDRQTDGRMDDGQRVITIVHLSLRLRCTKNAKITPTGIFPCLQYLNTWVFWGLILITSKGLNFYTLVFYLAIISLYTEYPPYGSSNLASIRTWWPVRYLDPATRPLCITSSLSSDSHFPSPSCNIKSLLILYILY